MWTKLRDKWGIGLLLGAYVLLGLTYSAVTPVFEAPDEPQHFFYARHVALTGRLPLPGEEGLWHQEVSQPPLYYALAAGIIRPLDTSDAGELARPNPHAFVGIPLAPDNKNAYVHTAREDFPWRDTALTVRLVRVLSVCLGSVTVLMTYLLGLELGLGALVSLGGAAVAAFLPQFLFISGSVNNDNLVTALCAAGLWALVRHLNRGHSARRALLLGLLSGLAALAKLSGAGLLVLCGFALLWHAWRRRDRAWLRDAAIVLAVWLAVAGWWFARNYALHGELTGTALMIETMGRRTDIPTFPDLWGELRGLVGSFWGLFGWFNVPAPSIMYDTFNVLAVAAALGWAVGILFHRGDGMQRKMAWPALWTLIIAAGLAQWTAQTHASQGRLLFPALPAIALILTAGWAALVPVRLRGPGIGVLAAAFLFWAAWSPFGVILPAYAPPPILSEDALPDGLKPLDATVGDAAVLIGYSAEPETVRTGEEVAATLCWRPLRKTDVNYSVYVHILGRGQAIVGQRDTYPGGGSLPTSDWEPGTAFCDTLRIPIAADAEGPTVLRLTAGLYDLASGERLPVFDSLGRATVIMENVGRLAGGAAASPEHAASAAIGDEVELTGWDAAVLPDSANQVRVTLYWRASAAPKGDYVVFTHLLDASGNMVAGHDGIPVGGDYPTQWWLPGEVIEDVHILQADSPIPPGEYMIEAGMYPVGAQEDRLPVTVGGESIPERRILLGPVVY